MKVFFIIIYIAFTNCAYAQYDTTTITEKDTIYFHNGQLVFPGKTIDASTSIYGIAISPSKTKAAILKYPELGDSSTIVRIFNNSGIETGKFEVLPLNNIVIADDCRFALYGCDLATSYEVVKTSSLASLAVYDIYGKQILYMRNSFACYQEAVFIPKDNFLIFLGRLKEIKTDSLSPVSFFVLNSDYHKIIEHKFDNWLGDFKLPEIKIKNKNELILTRHFYDIKETSIENLIINYRDNSKNDFKGIKLK